jgi:hypothetical protein
VTLDCANTGADAKPAAAAATARAIIFFCILNLLEV